MRTNEVKAGLVAGEVKVGTWIHTLGARQLPQVLATAGFDYVHIDMEHSAFSLETVTEMCQAALVAGLMPIVRPPGKDHHLISRPLDNGALGVLVPHVDTSEQAEAAVQAAKFPPRGLRGSQPPSIHTSFARVDAREYMAKANRETLVMVQIESREAIDNLDSILSVDGVDGSTLGRGDLAAELGVSDRDHPEVIAGLEKMIDSCRRHGKIPGLMVQQTDDARRWVARGIRYVTYASEVLMIRSAGESAVAEIRTAASEVPPHT
jgi:2-keto-3-deoxy-L-rhamnonate aldolase RhmA